MIEWTGTPAYKQVAEDLRRRIAEGEFARTGQLPSLAQIRERYDVTVTVARDAIRQLKTDGLAVSHQGKGAFLTSDSVTLARQAGPESAIAELRDEMSRLKSEVNELRERVAALEAG